MERVAETAGTEPGQPVEIVNKVWGWEEIICNNERYCLKKLILLPGFQCSLHRHIQKDETFYVMKGECALEIGGAVRYLCSGESQRILPGTWHRFTNENNVPCVIMEASTHHEESDVERKEPSRKL